MEKGEGATVFSGYFVDPSIVDSETRQSIPFLIKNAGFLAGGKIEQIKPMNWFSLKYFLRVI